MSMFILQRFQGLASKIITIIGNKIEEMCVHVVYINNNYYFDNYIMHKQQMVHFVNAKQGFKGLRMKFIIMIERISELWCRSDEHTDNIYFHFKLP